MNKKDNKIKNITVKIDTTYKYVQLWNGIFNLTEKGLQILAAFIDVQLITEDENFCSVKNKKEAARIVGIKDYNTLNNYVKRFKDKGVIIKEEKGYKLNSLLHPHTNLVHVAIKS
tara:strand:- start:2470 stop:2814 length:345 start_codon:yes stop_codon:yes gene_type:complete